MYFKVLYFKVFSLVVMDFLWTDICCPEFVYFEVLNSGVFYTGTITKKGQIGIPGSVREPFLPGKKGAIRVYDDRFELRKPLGMVEEALTCAYASQETLKKDWDPKKEDVAWKSL